MTPLEELEAWNRKGYYWSINCGGNYQPGDGVTVTLSAAGRKVQVGDYELEVWEEDGDSSNTFYPSIGDVIHEAIKRWHSDTTPKTFRVLWTDKNLVPETLTGWDVWCGNAKYKVLTVGTEAEALEAILVHYRNAGLELPEVHCYEKLPVNGRTK